MSLKNQIAIVTGGGQGIGQQIALRLAAEDAIVVIADINDQGSRETAEMIAKLGGREARVFPTDVSSEKQVANLMQGTLNQEHRIDILVNNSGIMGPVKNIEDISIEEWDATMAVNLRGIFLCCKYAIPQMKVQKKGSIVNIASVTGKCPLIQRAPYAASKMGVIGLTRTLAAEVGKWKIRVNAVCPAGVTGKRLDQVYEGIMKHTGKAREQVIAERIGASPLQEFVDPKYIAAAVAFLCSEDAAMMTGQDINISGGAVMY
ncbi:MAG: SDR family NAD(P)-dependent oxidoreductase [Deltaproteobacteria bacterium]